MKLEQLVGIVGVLLMTAACGDSSEGPADAAIPAPDAALEDAASGLDASAPDAASLELHLALDPRATYLRTNSDTPEPPEAFDLAAMGLAPGSTVTLRRAGTFDNGNGSERHGLTGVFSATDVILGATEVARVPGAIDAGDDVVTETTNFPQPEGLPTDIPEDFEISDYSGDPDSVTLQIPDGAAFLFVSPLDAYFVDNLVTAGVVFELVIEQ